MHRYNKDMRLHYEMLKRIHTQLGEFTIESYSEESQTGLFIRFGYWNRIDFQKLTDLLPNGTQVYESIIDETDEGLTLWGYYCYYGHP